MTSNNQFELDASGQPGESVFTGFTGWCLRDVSIDTLRAELSAELEHVKEYHDERLLVLLGALIVENALDSFLAGFMPQFSTIRDNRDFSFSMRIDLAKSLRLVPSKVLGAADTVRSIRNDFIHDLKVNSFTEIKTSRIAAMRTHLNQFGVPVEQEEGPPQLYNYLVTVTTMALRIYGKHLAVMNEFVRSDAFTLRLQEYADSRKSTI